MFKNKYPILLAQGPDEIEEANNLNAKVVLDGKDPVNIKTLVSLIYKSKFIVSNDTGIHSFIYKNGIVLFKSYNS